MAQNSGGATAIGGSSTLITGGSQTTDTGGALATGGSKGQLATGGALATGGSTGQLATGGKAPTGGKAATGGNAPETGGIAATGGKSANGGAAATGGKSANGGVAATGGNGGVAATGGKSANGGVVATGGTSAGGVAGTGGTKAVNTSTNTGTCTASTSTGRNVTGTGPHKVVMETNSGSGIKAGVIYRPSDLGGTEKYPIFVWGEGACTQDGTANQAAMAEIASHGYFVVADGTVGGTGQSAQDGSALLAYVTWAIAENDKPCSAYYQSLDTTKIAADGFSCGGLMAENASGDSRFTAVGITSSGLFSADQNLYKKIHTPFKILLGGSDDMAYENGMRDYDQISALGKPVLLLSKNGAGHGGDLGRGTGDFNTVNLAWLNWQLKGDETATGKALLIGSSCKYCKSSGWEFKTNIQ
jgi:hypothetical protein